MTDLDDAYANMAYIPGGAGYPTLWAGKAEAFRAGVTWRTEAWGPGPRQGVDLFLPQRAAGGTARGTVVFVHGGYWLKFSPRDFSHLAAGALAAGWAVAMPGYDLAPQLRLHEITAQVARGVTLAARHLNGPLRLVGHSAGGHLVARMVCPDVLPADVLARVEHVVPISPLSDLAPLQRTAMRTDLGLDDAEVATESPVHHPAPALPVHVWVGGAERPAFLDQARWLAKAWGCALTVEPDRHHFNVIEGLETPHSPLMQAVIG